MSAERPGPAGQALAGPAGQALAGLAGRPGARAALLVLADGRLPAGGHAHSGGMEAAIVDGGIRGLDDLAEFLRGRLSTAGLLSAAFAAAACEASQHGREASQDGELLAALDTELDARTPSPAQRDASRAQGRTLLRAGRAAWDLAGAALPAAPHHPVALGVVAAAAGLGPADAALVACYGAVSGPASAATRLLGLDPLAVTGLQARLAVEVESVAATATAAATAALAAGRPDLLPAPSAVRLDLLAERHRAAPVRMFTS
nr:urease accessory UreF family protein [Pseudofrankia inefficax]